MGILIAFPSLGNRSARRLRPYHGFQFTTATAILDHLPGSTCPHLVSAEDGNLYVLKCIENPFGPRILVNEYLARRLAIALDLPVPKAALIAVPPSFDSIHPGIHFGSRLCRNRGNSVVHESLPQAAWGLVENALDLAGAFLFDLWLGNSDRREIVLVRQCRPDPFKLVLIDNSHCFGGASWAPLEAYPDCAYPMRFAYDQVAGWAALDPWLEKVEQINREVVTDAANGIPDEWLRGEDQVRVQHLLQEVFMRRVRLRSTVNFLISSGNHPFRKWRDSPRGALLHWPVRSAPNCRLGAVAVADSGAAGNQTARAVVLR